MGFAVGQRTYVLHFDEGTYFSGAEIRVRPATIATVEAVEEIHTSEAFPIFLEHVQSWNLETADGTALPVELDACRQVMEPAERNSLVRAWYTACVGASAPLDPPSDDGEPSPNGDPAAPLIPMEPL